MKNEQKNLENIACVRQSKNHKTGILMMLACSFFFAVTRVVVKSIVDIPILEMLIFQYLPVLLIAPFIIRNKALSYFGKNKLHLFLRGFFGFLAGMLGIYAIKNLNLADSSAISQLNPIFVILFSYFLLKEKIFSQQWVILSFAFLGALLIIRPGFDLNFLPAIVGVMASFFSGLAHTFVRALRKTEHPIVIANYHAYFSSVMSFLILLIGNNFVLPERNQMLVLILLGIFSSLGQLSLTNAYGNAPSKIISVYGYSQVAFSIIFGYLFFREIPNLLSVLGIIIIISSGMLNYKIGLSLEYKMGNIE